MKRDEIIKNYQARIKESLRERLTGFEQECLLQAFIKDLKSLNTEAEIQARCQEEIALLEQGYSKETVAKTRLNRYRRAIQDAVDAGQLKLTKTNSKYYKYEKKQGTEKTGEIGEAHHHFGWLYMHYDNDTYIAFNEGRS